MVRYIFTKAGRSTSCGIMKGWDYRVVNQQALTTYSNGRVGNSECDLRM